MARRSFSLVTEGCNRFVLLTPRHAVKFPSLRCWRDFLFGLLNNLHEAHEQHEHPSYCPVLWASPLGVLLVMPRVDVFDKDQYDAAVASLPTGTCAEMKPSSWGRLGGRVVAIDYGWPTFGWPGKS